MENRKCRTCSKEKPIDQFECISPVKGWHRRQCNACILERNRGHVSISKQRIQEYHRDYYRKNKDKLDKRSKDWIEANPDRRRTTGLYHYYNLQNQAIMAYGGYRCAWCGIDEPLVLAIDHVNNDGNEHRKVIGAKGGVALYKWLRDQGYPEGFQVLCMNCNHAKYRNKGVLPESLKGRCIDHPSGEYAQASGSAKAPNSQAVGHDMVSSSEKSEAVSEETVGELASPDEHELGA